MLAQLRPAIVSFFALTLITGVAYPLAVSGVARACFARQAQGSVIERDGKAVGSSLIAQPFTTPGYFWPRPSAAGSNGYDATSSSGSNIGPSNPALVEAVQGRIAALHNVDPTNVAPIPVDLVTASGSGLDPHESVAAARYQLTRVAAARGVPAATIEPLIAAHTDAGIFGIFGDPAVNVLDLNLALDRLAAPTAIEQPASTVFTTERVSGFVKVNE